MPPPKDPIKYEEYLKKQSESRKGYVCSEETKLKISKTKLGILKSEETKDKMSTAMIGNKNGRGNRGKHTSEETKKKQSNAKKGIPLSKEHIEKIKLSNLDKFNSGQFKIGQHISPETEFQTGSIPWNKDIMWPEMSGENNPMYGKFGIDHPSYKNPEDRITILHTQIRNSDKYVEWSKLVKERDNYICRCCNIKGGNLHSHHIIQFSVLVENIKSVEEANVSTELYDIENGITYCKSCHDLLSWKGGLL